MNEGQPCKVCLLNGEALQVYVSAKLYVEELLAVVAGHCGICHEDRRYFSLTIKDEREQCHWLPNERLILGHESREETNESRNYLVLYHQIKFYPSSYAQIKDPTTLIWFFYDFRLKFLKGQIFLTNENYIKACAILIVISIEDDEYPNVIEIFREKINPSYKTLMVYNIDITYLEDSVLKTVDSLMGLERAGLVSLFLNIAQSSMTYGCYFYGVNDRSLKLKLAINSRGILELDHDLLRTRKIFYWKQLDNLYYRGNIFTIEVRSIDDPLNGMLTREDSGVMNHANSRGASNLFVNKVHHFTYYCESVNLCRTIWSFAIAQHQFLLDEQRYKKVYDTHPLYEVDLKELTDKLNAFLTQPQTLTHTFNHRIPTIDQNPMPSAKVADGSTASSTCKNIPATAIYKTEEDRQRDIEQFKALQSRRNELEEKLLAKLEELKSVCISEGEITGELPKEIYRTLMPGEPEPKIKKRVGTSFKFPQEILDCSFAEDKVVQLEADIELHRKIVAAAERLAKDKSTNKSVRKKRRKDLQAATQKLRGLEKGLHKLRLSSSKPDVASIDSHSTGSIFSLNSLKGWPNFAHSSFRFGTKSCPTTPRGSVPDLSSDSSDKSFMSKILNKSITPSKKSDLEPSTAPVTTFSMASSRASSRDPSPFAFSNERNHEFSSASTSRVDSNRNSYENNGHGQGLEKKMPDLDTSIMSSHIPVTKDIPIYANVGYKTSEPYRSAYRQINYPTLHEQSDHNLLNARSTGFSAFHHYSTPQLRAPDPNLKPIAMSNSATNFGIKRPETYLPQSANTQFGILMNGSKSSTDMPSVAALASTELGRIVQKMNGGLMNQPLAHEHSRNHSPSRWPPRDGYSTASLDRRMLKARQHQNGAQHDQMIKSTSNGRILTTTFPAGAVNEGGVIETTRPLEAADILKYRSSHPNDSMKSVSASAIHPNRLYSAQNGTPWHQHLSHGKDPRMEALLEQYKKSNGNSMIPKPTPTSNPPSSKSATMV